MARYVASFVDQASDWESVSVSVIIYVIYFNIGLHCNGTWLCPACCVIRFINIIDISRLILAVLNDAFIFIHISAIFHSATFKNKPTLFLIRAWCGVNYKPLTVLTHWGQVTHICVSELTIIGHIMACRLAGAKPLSESMMEYFNLTLGKTL